MGQVALGFRSLLVKLAVFFVLASLLAWALGGTLWPRTEIVDGEGVTFGETTWFWRLQVGGKERGRFRWQLMTAEGDAEPLPVDERFWDAVAGPALLDGSVFVACRSGGRWRIETVEGLHTVLVPDRLAVEQQLARLAAGLDLQDADTIAAQRGNVLDPPPALSRQTDDTPSMAPQ